MPCLSSSVRPGFSSTSSDDGVRNGARATELADKAVTLTNGTDVSALDILSAAYAETGQFEKAISTIVRAMDVDAKLGGSPLSLVIRGHLQLYRGEATDPDDGMVIPYLART